MSVRDGTLVFKAFIPKDTPQARKQKRERRRVPDEQRKRARQACKNCRLKKDKCEGGLPCERCRREGVECCLQPSTRMSKSERAEHLEKVLNHVLGIPSLDDDELRALSSSIGNLEGRGVDPKELGNGSSLLTFARELEERLGDARSSGVDDEERTDEGDAIATFCRSPSSPAVTGNSSLDSTLAVLPEIDIAEHLVRVCFAYVQCNSFYAQESWVFEQIRRCYAIPPLLSERDLPTVATLLMIMALGSQFTSDLALQNLGADCYERTRNIVPELVERSTFECVRACLLLATYLFPVNLPGLAYTYLGLALHMAMRNNMHKTLQDEVEIRVWWTLYTFYQRARIYHGHPKTLSSADVHVRRPRPVPRLEPTDGVSNFRNQVALIEITMTLEKAVDEIAALRRNWKAAPVANLLALRRKLVEFLDTLPDLDRRARDSASEIARLRLDVHVYLHYWQTRLFLGRPFLLKHSGSIPAIHKAPSSPSAKHLSAGDLLARDSVDAAINIIQLCQMIHDKIGLARASYATEFTSCRAAMLVLVAKGISDKSSALRDLLAQGLTLIQHMSTSHGQAGAEARVIEALQRAITRLHENQNPRQAQTTLTSSDGAVSNDDFKQWELLWQRHSMPSSGSDAQDSIHLGTSLDNPNESQLFPETTLVGGFGVLDPEPEDTWNAIFNFQLDQFSLIPCADTNSDPSNYLYHVDD